MLRAMDFLLKKRRGDPPPTAVVFGDDDFLARQARRALREWIIGPDPDDFNYAVHEGAQAALASVLDDLRTPSMLGDRKLVVVEAADKFVTQHRAALERYAARPAGNATLLLMVDSWPATTKLAKAIEQDGLAIDAKPIPAWTTAAWCVQWAGHAHRVKMDKSTAEWLVELVGADLGLLDQEMAKLATAVGAAGTIDRAAVSKWTVGARMESAFKLLDAAFEGRVGEALKSLDRQLAAGESPVGVLAMITSQVRRLTQAARLAVAGRPLMDALLESGMPKFACEKSAATLRKLGRAKMAGMYRRLLTADLNLKGGSELPARTVLERFLIELADQR